MDEEKKRFLCHKELASLLRMTSGGLHNCRLHGRIDIPTVRPVKGGRILFDIKDVEEFIEKSRNKDNK
jgi:hypothetical protein